MREGDIAAQREVLAALIERVVPVRVGRGRIPASSAPRRRFERECGRHLTEVPECQPGRLRCTSRGLVIGAAPYSDCVRPPARPAASRCAAPRVLARIIDGGGLARPGGALTPAAMPAAGAAGWTVAARISMGRAGPSN